MRPKLSQADREALEKSDVSEPRIVETRGTDRVVEATAADEVTPVRGTWHDGESADDIKWEYD